MFYIIINSAAYFAVTVVLLARHSRSNNNSSDIRNKFIYRSPKYSNFTKKLNFGGIAIPRSLSNSTHSCGATKQEVVNDYFEDDYLIYNEIELGDFVEPVDNSDVGKFTKGTEKALIKEFPYVIAIFKDNIFHCGGTLVTTQHILTAAHCVTTKKGNSFILQPVDEYWIRVGATNFDQGGNIHYVKTISVHPKFLNEDQVMFYRDLAIITLSYKVIIGENIQPAELHPPIPDEEASMEGKIYQIAGWGMSWKKGTIFFSKRLRKTTAIKMQTSDCLKYFLNYFGTFDSEVQICAQVVKNSCLGNPGAGIFYGGKLIAITTWALGCPYRLPAIYARADNIRTFVDSQTKEFISSSALSQLSSISSMAVLLIQ